MSGFQLENYLNWFLQNYGFWSSRMHPLDAMRAATPRNPPPRKPKNKKPNRDSVLRLLTTIESRPHLERRLRGKQNVVTKCNQQDNSSLPAILENNPLAVETKPLDIHLEFSKAESRKELDETKKPRKPSFSRDKLTMLGTLSTTAAKKFARKIFDEFNVIMPCLDCGGNENVVFIPDDTITTIRKKIRSRFRTMASKDANTKKV